MMPYCIYFLTPSLVEVQERKEPRNQFQPLHLTTSPTEGIGRGVRSTGAMCLCYVHQWACVIQGWAQTSNSSEDTLGHVVFEREGLGQGLMPFRLLTFK